MWSRTRVKLSIGFRYSWRSLLVLAAVCSLSFSLATRYSSPPILTARYFSSHSQSKSADTARQRLEKEVSAWMATPIACFAMLTRPVSYSRFAAIETPSPGPPFHESLYNRPPPSFVSLA